MAAEIIDGKRIANEIIEETRQETEAIRTAGGRTPRLAVVIVGGDPASRIYVKNKTDACERAGIASETHELPDSTTQAELLGLVDELNANGEVDGILVQFPLPDHLDESEVITRIDPAKDVDGFHPVNAGLLAVGGEGLFPCTPAGIVELLRRSGVEIRGKRCAVVGRSNVVGKPAAMLLLREDATVTICHSKTSDLPAVTREADILVAALGKRGFITPDMVKEGAVIVDVGIHRTPGSKKISGDADRACAEKASLITPVPGGVGPMTIAMLIKNCVKAYKARHGAV